jgi:DNA repair protein RAD16
MMLRYVLTSLSGLTLSRTKLERADDLGLPPRTIVVRRDFFSPAEKEIYLSLFTNARRTFNTYLDSGTVLNSELSSFTKLTADYSNIFSLITRSEYNLFGVTSVPAHASSASNGVPPRSRPQV